MERLDTYKCGENNAKLPRCKEAEENVNQTTSFREPGYLSIVHVMGIDQGDVAEDHRFTVCFTQGTSSIDDREHNNFESGKLENDPT